MSVPQPRSYIGPLEREPQSADTTQPVEPNNSEGLDVDSGWKAFLRAESQEFQPSEDVKTPTHQPEMTDYFDDYSSSQPILSVSPESQQQTELFKQFPHYGRAEVVLDDGTSQYRSVSLSTLPDLDLVRSRSSQYNASENTPLLGQAHTRKYGDSASSSDSDSDDEEVDIPLPPLQRWIQQYFPVQNWTFPTLSSAQESIIKCCIAYALACMFTWIPALNVLLGDSATSSHMIATASVWFHPAKTLGGMVEAISVAFLYFTFGVIISCLSMLSTLALYERDAANWAHFVSLVFWLGGSTFLIQLSKVYFDRPSFNTGASISALILFTVIVKEGSESAGEFSTDRIKGISLAVGIGLLISVVTCFLFLPKSAGRQLQDDIAKSLASFRLLLKLLTKTFLLDTDLPQFMANDNLQQAIKDHHASFTAMEKSLIEAKLEFMQLDTWSKCKDYSEVVDSLQRLAQHVGGLRSSCGVQFELLKEEDVSPEVLEEAQRQRRSVSKRMERLTRKMSSDPKAPEARKKPGTEREETYNVRAGYTRRKFQDEMQKEIRRRSTIKASPPKSNMHTIMEDVEDEVYGAFPNSRPERLADEVPVAQAEGRSGSITSNSSLKDAGGLIDFLGGIGPSMKSLGYTCKRTLMHLERMIKPQETSLEWILHHCCLKTRPEPTDTPSLQQLHSNLAKAIDLFEHTHEEAIAAMYKQQLSLSSTPTNGTTVKVDGLEDVRVSQPYETGPGEQVFLVYYFVFCLEQFARELLVLVEEVRDLYEIEEEQTSSFDFLTSPMALFRDRSQDWKHQVGQYRQSRKAKHADEMQHIADAITASTLQVALPITSKAKFVPNQRHMPETLHTPLPANKISRFIRYFWACTESLKSYTVKYALKTSLAIMLIATPAFMESTKAIFREYRMEWCLITLMVVMTPTIGGTQSSAVYRIISTIIGCYTAVAFWLLFPGNSIALPILTFLFSIPNFWYVFCASYNPKMGRMTLLAYNLTMLRSYNYRDVEDYSISDLAVHRLIAISIGVLTGVAVTYWIWPYRAREELREGLSNLLLNLAWLYNQHVAIQSRKVGQQSVGRSTSESDNVVAVTVEQEAELAREVLQHLEREIQVDLLRLCALLKETPHEPRFKGPFPTETYNALLTSCQNILDRFTSMRIALSRSPAMNVELHRDFIQPVNAERREMMQNVLLFFYTLASALKLKTPLPPGLPPAQQSWKRLMHKIRDLEVVRERRLLQDDEKYISYYAFIAMMEEVVRELTKMGSKMSDLFGFLVNLDTWNSYFN